MNNTNGSAPTVVVVGTGGAACRIQIPALRAAGFKVVGLVGTDAKRTADRAAVNDVPQAFTDLDSAITKTNPTAVAVGTTPHSHAPLVLAAIARGRHILCEKPFAKDSAEARAMLDAATKAGVVHALGNEFRWDPTRVTVARVIARGLIGEPRFLTMTQFNQYVSNPDVQLPSWWLDPKEGGGWLNAQGSHMIDCVRIWLGDFACVNAALQRVTVPKTGAEDSYSIRFRLTNGVQGTIHQAAGAWGPMANILRVAGTEGTVWIDKGAVWLAGRDGAREVPIEPELRLPPIPPLSADPRHQLVEWKMLAAAELPPYQRLCEAWRAAIEGRPVPTTVPVPSFADGVKNMTVLDAARKSAASDGERVAIM